MVFRDAKPYTKEVSTIISDQPTVSLFCGGVFCFEEGSSLFFQAFNLWTKTLRITTQTYTANSPLPEFTEVSIQTYRRSQAIS